MFPALPAPVSLVASGLLVSLGGVLGRIVLPDIAKTRIAKGSFLTLVGVVCLSHVCWVRAPFSFTFAYWGARVNRSQHRFVTPWGLVFF